MNEGIQNQGERKLVERYASLCEDVNSLTIQLTEKKKTLEQVESDLIELLDAGNKKSSARYRGIGWVTCVEPKLYASIKKGEEELLFDHLRSLGRDDLIKTTIHTSALSSYVRDAIKNNGAAILPGINYYFKRTMLFTSDKS